MRTSTSTSEANYHRMMFNLAAAAWAAGLGESAMRTLLEMIPEQIPPTRRRPVTIVAAVQHPAPARGALLWE